VASPDLGDLDGRRYSTRLIRNGTMRNCVPAIEVICRRSSRSETRLTVKRSTLPRVALAASIPAIAEGMLSELRMNHSSSHDAGGRGQGNVRFDGNQRSRAVRARKGDDESRVASGGRFPLAHAHARFFLPTFHNCHAHTRGRGRAGCSS